MGVSAQELSFVTDDITHRVGYLDVVVQDGGGALPYRCADLLAAQERGEDPTRWWREQVGANQEAYYGAAAPPQVGAAFVLEWYLGVIAVPLAWAAVLGPWVLDGSPAALSFDLSEPDLYPQAVAVSPDGVETIADEGERLARARERYDAHAMAFATSYAPPEVKMGTGQRYGLVHDAWTAALENALAATRPAGQGPTRRSRRKGCCMIYALPGAHECASCPRRARADAAGPIGRHDRL